MQNADEVDDDTVVSTGAIDDDRTISTRRSSIEDDNTVVGGRGAGVDEKTQTVTKRRVNSAVGAVANGRVAFVPVTQREHYEVRSAGRTTEPVARSVLAPPVRERSASPVRGRAIKASRLIAIVVGVTVVTAGIVLLILTIALR